MIKPIPLNKLPKVIEKKNYASERDRERCAQLSAHLDEPTAFEADGELLLCCNCHGSAGTFPLVCWRGKEAHWDSEAIATDGHHDIPRHEGDGPSVVIWPISGIGQNLYNGYIPYKWHVTKWVRRSAIGAASEQEQTVIQLFA